MTKICAKKHPEKAEYCTAVPGHQERNEGTCRFRPVKELTQDELRQCGAQEDETDAS